jgi:carbon storage regulator CsrA
MLCLSRRKGESIILEDEETGLKIKILVLQGGKQVRLGIDAPERVHVRREEIAPLAKSARTVKHRRYSA